MERNQRRTAPTSFRPQAGWLGSQRRGQGRRGGGGRGANWSARTFVAEREQKPKSKLTDPLLPELSHLSSEGDPQKRSKARETSKAAFDAVSSDVMLIPVCLQCLPRNQDGVEADDVIEGSRLRRCVACPRNRLIGRMRSESVYTLVQAMPRMYVEGNRRCDFSSPAACTQGKKCGYPHSEVEGRLWAQFHRRRWDLDRFIDDFKKLYLSWLATEIVKYYQFTLSRVCKRCVKRKAYDLMNKKAHQPECRGSHAWTDATTALIMYRGESVGEGVNLSEEGVEERLGMFWEASAASYMYS